LPLFHVARGAGHERNAARPALDRERNGPTRYALGVGRVARRIPALMAAAHGFRPTIESN